MIAQVFDWLRLCVCSRVFVCSYLCLRIGECFAEIRCYLCSKWKRMRRNEASIAWPKRECDEWARERAKHTSREERKDTRRFRQFNKQFCLICHCVHISIHECFSTQEAFGLLFLLVLLLLLLMPGRREREWDQEHEKRYTHETKPNQTKTRKQRKNNTFQTVTPKHLYISL